VRLNGIAAQRLQNQRITQPGPRQPAQLVAWLGAVQAQEYAAAKWALGLRMPNGATDARIERAFNEGRILRTHVLRPTWHFVAAADIHWMLELTAPRVHRALAYAHRFYELDITVRSRAATLFEQALSGGQHLTRAELGVCLARGGLAATGVRLALLTIHAELEGVMCSGSKRGTQHTYAHLVKRAPRARRLVRDEALAELTKRYFRSHGPATLRDFMWWSGLTTADAKRGLEMTGARTEAIDGHTYWTCGRAGMGAARNGLVHLLPVYDEYLVAYRDHHAVPRQTASRGTLSRAVVAAGYVAGTWNAVRSAGALVVEVMPHRPFTGRERRALTEAALRYGRFLQATVSIRIA
jgi:hypothetical protein